MLTIEIEHTQAVVLKGLLVDEQTTLMNFIKARHTTAAERELYGFKLSAVVRLMVEVNKALGVPESDGIQWGPLKQRAAF